LAPPAAIVLWGLYVARRNPSSRRTWARSRPWSSRASRKRRLRHGCFRLRALGSPADREPRLARELWHARGSAADHDAPSDRPKAGLAGRSVFPERDAGDFGRHSPTCTWRDDVRPRAVRDGFLARSARPRRDNRGEGANVGRPFQPFDAEVCSLGDRMVRVVLGPWAFACGDSDSRRSREIRDHGNRSAGLFRRLPLYLGARRAAEVRGGNARSAGGLVAAPRFGVVAPSES